MGYILCLAVDCRFLIRILVIYRHSGFNGGDLGMADRYPDSLALWVDRMLSRIDDLEAKASGCGNAILKLTGDIERLEERLTAMDRRIESLVGRSVPATECEPTALHELRAVLEYAVGLAAASDSNQLFFNGFMECRRMMIRAIEIRLQAFD